MGRNWSPALLVLLGALAFATSSAQEDGAAAAGAVAVDLSFGEVKVALKAADGSTISSLSGNYPKAVLSSPQLPVGASLDVTFVVNKGGESSKPQQAMLMLRSKSLGIAAYAVAKSKGGSLTASINAAAVEKQIGKVSGDYEAVLLAGDPAASKGLSYELGSLELLASPSSSAPEPAAAVRTAAFQPVNNIKPEIAHMFRAPEKRPPAVVSLTFAALVFVPLAVVIVYVPAATGVNFKLWGVAPLPALLFHGGVAAMLGLYLLFFVKLNLAQTLPLAGLGGLFVAGSGYALLSALSAQRLKKKED